MTASAGPALKRLYAEFGDRVAFLTLYVREAHPGERYPQPQTFEEKLAHARAYEARDQIPWPVVVDDITGSLHQTLDARPEAAYLMDTDGIVAFRALWANDERVLHQVLKAIVSGQPSPLGENQEKLIPMLKGMGVMYEILGFAGKPARGTWRAKCPRCMPSSAWPRSSTRCRPWGAASLPSPSLWRGCWC